MTHSGRPNVAPRSAPSSLAPSPTAGRRASRTARSPLRHEHAARSARLVRRAVARLAASRPDYPDASYLPLKRAIAAHAGVDPARSSSAPAPTRCSRLCAQLALGRGDTALVPSRPTSSTPSPRATRAPRCSRSPGAALGSPRAVREAATCGSSGSAAQQPDGEQLDAARRATCASAPGHRRARPGLPRARRRGPLAARRATTRTSSSRARSRRASRSRGARRLRPGAARAGRALDALRPPASISSWSAALAELACARRTRCGSAAAAIVERDRLAAAHAGRRVRGRGRRATSCSPCARRCRPSRAPARAGPAWCARSPRAAARRLLPRHGLAPPPTTRPPRGARRSGRRRRAAPRTARGERTAERRTRETGIDCGSSSAAAGRASRPASASSTTCSPSLAFWSLTDIELRCNGDLWVDEHHTVEDCAIALGEAFDPRSATAPACAASAPRARRSTRRSPRPPSTSAAAASRSIDLALAARRSAAAASLVPHFFDSLRARPARPALTARGRRRPPRRSRPPSRPWRSRCARRSSPSRAGAVACTKGVL